jgi:hypothetical protein
MKYFLEQMYNSASNEGLDKGQINLNDLANSKIMLPTTA